LDHFIGQLDRTVDRTVDRTADRTGEISVKSQ
jgi:hypothetical protein